MEMTEQKLEVTEGVKPPTGLDLDSPPDDDFSPQRIIELFEKLLREGKSISIAATSNNEDDEGIASDEEDVKDEKTEKTNANDWCSMFPFINRQGHLENVDKVLSEVETGRTNLTSGANEIVTMILKTREFSSLGIEIVSSMTEAIGLRAKNSDMAIVSSHLVLSEALQHIFHIGVGAGSLDFTSIRLAQIKCQLDEISAKIDVLLKSPFKTAIKHFQSSLNTLEFGNLKTALHELKQAKTKANEAMANFEGMYNRAADFDSIIKCVQILAFSVLLVHSLNEEMTKILPYSLLTQNVKKLIAIEHIAILDSLLLIQSRYRPPMFSFRKWIKVETIQNQIDQVLKSLYQNISIGMGWTPSEAGTVITDSTTFSILPKYLPVGSNDNIGGSSWVTSPPNDRAEVILGVVKKSKSYFDENPFLKKILPNGGLLTILLWRDEVQTRQSYYEKTRIVIGELCCGGESTGHKFYQKIEALEDKMEIELKRDVLDVECDIVSYGILDQYVGFFDGKDRMSGMGTMTSPDGNKYVGQFKSGLKHGYGVFTFGEKIVQERIQQNLKLLLNTFQLEAKSNENIFNRYEGFWENGIKKGHGTLYYKDGRKHTGFFDNDEIQGQGILYARDGIILQEGTWLSSTMVRYGAFSYLAEDIIKTDRDFKQDIGVSGTLFFYDGNQYSGGLLVPFLNPFGHPRCFHGQGTLANQDGTVLHQGRWDFGRFRGNSTTSLSTMSGWVFTN